MRAKWASLLNLKRTRALVLAIVFLSLATFAGADVTLCETTRSGNCVTEHCKHYRGVRFVNLGDTVIAIYYGYLGETWVTYCN